MSFSSVWGVCKWSYRLYCSNLGNARKVIVSLAELLELCPKVCHWEGCAAAVNVTTKFVGCSVTLAFKCSTGHVYNWHSSSQHANEKGSIFSNNLSLASAIVYSGKSFTKIKRLLILSNWSAYHNPCSIGTNFLSKNAILVYGVFPVNADTSIYRLIMW